MNRRLMLIVAVLALLLSGGITYLTYRVLQTRLQPPAVTDKIVVAAKKLDLGTRLKKEDVRLVEWPKSTQLTGSFTDIAAVTDRALIMPVQVNEPILESKLAPKEAGAGLSAVIPEGMRALSIQVNSVIGVSGFVLPGSRVDLILTSVPPPDVKGAKGNETASKIILENLEVLAAGQNVQRDVDGKPQTVQDVTLLVTPDQAQRIALATGDGRIQLALRNPTDKETVNPPLVVRSALFEGPVAPGAEKSTRESAAEKRAIKPPVSAKRAVAPKKPAPVQAAAVTPPAQPPPRVLVIELIQGSRRAKEIFEEATPEQTETSTPSDRITK